MSWSRTSWKDYKILQQPVYQDESAVQAAKERLYKLPPLIFAGEVRNLKAELARASEGKSFLLQGGDCAESFNDFSANNIRDMFKVMLQMAIILTFAAGRPVVKVGRIAGQFAKPRSSDFEEAGGVSLPSYRGDIINGFEFNEAARKPDPARMIEAYHQSASTLNLLRAFSRGGLANLHEVHKWNLGFLKKGELEAKFNELSDEISRTLKFMEACGLSAANSPSLAETVLYTSHEALLLGERTRGADDAHVHFLSGIKNPLGVKIGPSGTADEILRLCDKLNPQNEAGRLNVIIRMGADKIGARLPQILRELKREGRAILYSIDPMHGNTVKAANGYKTREFSKILSEVQSFFEIHAAEGTHAGGIHLEMTGQNVTECTGGSFNVTQETLKQRYETQCDPRLNADQARELAFLLADNLKKAE